MGDLAGGSLPVALVQTATTLPVFLLVLPAGALGDILDRRRLLLTGQSLMLVGAAALAAVTAAGAVAPWSLLGLIAAMGVGQALSVPSFQAIQAELVPREELPVAALLNGANGNVARAVGPAIGGGLVAVAGPEATFALNAVSFLGVLLVLLRWRRPPDHRPLGAEHIRSALRAGARYVASAPAFRAVLIRSTLFMVFASGLWALLPAVARGPLALGPAGYGALLGCLGVGAVIGALVVPAARARLGANHLVTGAAAAYGGGMLLAAFSTAPTVVGVALVGVGLAWIAAQSTLNAMAQVILPRWTRARALAYWQLTFMGGQALGAVLWGVVASTAGLSAGLAVPAAGLLVGAVAGLRRVRLPEAGLDVRPAELWPLPTPQRDPPPDAGPVLVTIEWRVASADVPEFLKAMAPVGDARRRSGASLWGVFQDIEDPTLFLETFTVATWHEHVRQHLERGTVMDRELEARVRALSGDGRAAPRVRHLLWGYSAWLNDNAPPAAG
jgi:MFS family permease